MDLSYSWLILLLLAETGLCSSGQIDMPAEVSGVRGKSVNFTALVPPSTEVQTVTWNFFSKSGSSSGVYTGTTQNEKVPDPYQGRVKYYRSVYTLELNSLTPSDSGTYALTIVNTNLDQLVGQTVLRVLEPVVDVSITSNLPEAVEFNSTVILTCNAKGSSLSYTWLNSSAPMVVDGKHVVQNGSQLIINEVLRTDLLGPITCTAKNLLESSTSAAFNLTVNYGPDSVTKTQDPAAEVLKKGSNLTLACSAKSSPAAEFVWLFNDAVLPQKSATVVLSNLGVEQSGNYSCMAYNSKTQRYVSSGVTRLSVLEAISGTKISASASSLIAGNSTVSLACSSSAGKADSFQWYKNDKPLVSSSRVTVNTSTVTILTVQKEDAAVYKCQPKNKISSETGDYSMTVNYGPEDMLIRGIKEAIMGETVQINCSFASFPVPTFIWKFNDSILVGETKQCYTIQVFENKDSGIYTCEAFNSITGLRKTASHNLMLKDEKKPSGLSGGAIAGIIIGVLLLLAIVIGVCIHKRRKISDVPSPY